MSVTVTSTNPSTGFVEDIKPVNEIVPFFRDRGFDPEATQALSMAYDIACRSLHPKGQPPVVQEYLAKKIIETALLTGWRRSLWESSARLERLDPPAVKVDDHRDYH
jgi:hypothetical protein